ncbi:MAG: Unknown protein [uncultured Thiotrichaceae bacterium]|uniref:histidine kinase n=1 Tax=uncultured Thiotrichaceae bacterium TaxID=298394 RepID=A0A6S6SCF6_9GAMM|nr:MAG: Unknown protein [uncultured Thiotrichaceae bacterium]
MLLQLGKNLRRYQNNFQRSSAIQQGILNISIFLISLFLLSIITYFFVQNALATHLDNNLQQRMNVLLEQIDEDDWEDDYEDDDDDDDDKTRSSNRRESLFEQQMFYRLFPAKELNAERNRAFRRPGYSTGYLFHADKRKYNNTLYRILVVHKYGLVYVVGENNENDHEVLEIVMSAFLLNGLIALILTALLVVYLANRAHRQIQRIEYVLHHAAQGDLKQRIGLSSKNNDLAHVSEQIDTMLSRLETSMAAMTDISANIAHELKTPVSRLRHDLITALEKQENGENIDETLNDAYEEAGQITETFDALLRIAQIEGGARRANFTELKLCDVTNTILDIYTEVAKDAGMSLVMPQTKQSEKPLLLHGDKELLIQMLANLVENAIRYCQQGTCIEITTRDVNGRSVELIVADNGAGIPPDEQKQVFQRLYRVDKSRSDQRGTGLGLSLVKAIIELHDASIELQDNHPGLRVIMEFPRS